MKLRILSGLWLLLMAGLAQAEDIQLNPSHPDRYVVVEGDTLWGIAGKFLTSPWQWPSIWHDNPQINNPHWIYPGDELVLSMVNGKPVLQVGQRGNGAERPDEVRLSPTIHAEPASRAIPTIPTSAIQPFLTEPKVADANVLEQMPYVFAFADEHVAGGTGFRAYVRGLTDNHPTGYVVFRQGAPYRDAESGEILGYEALYVAHADWQASGDPSTVLITKSARDVNIGDRILPVEAERLQMRFEPHAPAFPVWGHIISVVDGVSQIGQFNVVIIDRGAADGIESGHVLDIRQSGVVQRDIISPIINDTVMLPPEKEGLLMVFRAYERVSFGLVLSAVKAINVGDAVSTP